MNEELFTAIRIDKSISPYFADPFHVAVIKAFAARIEELLRANGRKRSDVEVAVSPSGKPATPDDLKRYRDAGVEEFVLTSLRSPRAPDEAVTVLEKAAREWLEPASKL